MSIKTITIRGKEDFNKAVTHPLQSYDWGVFRETTGIKVIRRGVYEKEKLIDAFQITIHHMPHTPFTIGYLPKGNMPTDPVLEELEKIGKQEKCIFIQIEPDIQAKSEKIKDKSEEEKLNIDTKNKLMIIPSYHPLFTKYTFTLDLRRSEDQLLAAMHPKTRYNIKVAQKHGVEVIQDNSEEAFEKYLLLTEETTKRQGFYAHTKHYHKMQWQIFSHQLPDGKTPPNLPLTGEERTGGNISTMNNELSSHLFTARYQGEILTAMMFFVFKDTMYYPYGASSNKHRNTMHSVLTMWEAIKWGRAIGLRKLDMWGALGENPDPKDPWYGFHEFKRKFGADHTEFVGSYDLIINPIMYNLYKIIDKLRWTYMRLKKLYK